MRAELAFLVLLAGAYAIDLPDGMVLTPFGVRSAQCVLEVESGSHIAQTATGLKITQRSYTGEISEQFVNVPEECHHDGFVQNYLQNRRTYSNGYKAASFPPINGWIDNGGWYPPSSQNNLNSYTSTYTVPGDPPADSGQVLFYFIGMQDNAYSAVNILQPVLTWGNGIKGWNLASWDCCPSNITVSSKSITGFGAGDLIEGYINRVNSDTWKINSVIQKTGANTTLTAQVGTYLYDWADVTLEVYGVSDCTQFAKGPMTFSKMVLKDAQGDTLNPQWSFTGQTKCSGAINQTHATTVTITPANA